MLRKRNGITYPMMMMQKQHVKIKETNWKCIFQLTACVISFLTSSLIVMSSTNEFPKLSALGEKIYFQIIKKKVEMEGKG